MDQNHEVWRFMRRRAEQLYEEGEVRRALRLMRRINQAQTGAFKRSDREDAPSKQKKIVSTH